MDDANRTWFTPDEDWSPETQSSGQLGPPGRKPPTAVATATPRPPNHPYRTSRYRRLTAVQRIARGMLSVLLVGSGALVVSLSAEMIGFLAGASLGGMGALVALNLVRQSRNNRRVRWHSAFRAPGEGGSDSVARSA